MNIHGDAKLIRIFIGENDMYKHRPVYEHIVLEARKAGLAGATVFRGVMGYGGASRIHTNKILRLSEDMPHVIEIVDEEKKIDEFIPVLEMLFDETKCGGLITVEKASIIKYSAGKG